MYNKMAQWTKFNAQVKAHIEQYTLKQYGNPDGDEPVDSFTPEDCWTNIQRYYNRRNSNVRGDKEKLRDLIKVAHYAQIIYDKLKEELNKGDIYQ